MAELVDWPSHQQCIGRHSPLSLDSVTWQKEEGGPLPASCVLCPSGCGLPGSPEPGPRGPCPEQVQPTFTQTPPTDTPMDPLGPLWPDHYALCTSGASELLNARPTSPGRSRTPGRGSGLWDLLCGSTGRLSPLIHWYPTVTPSRGWSPLKHLL